MNVDNVRRLERAVKFDLQHINRKTEPAPRRTEGDALCGFDSTSLRGDALFTVSGNQRRRLTAMLLGIPYVTTVWISMSGLDHVAVAVLNRTLGALFLGFTALTLLQQVMRRERVDTDTLSGTVVVYLLLGMVWALLYGLIEVLQPGSFMAIAD